MDPNSKKFRQLRKHWYQKLAEADFKDIEDLNGNLKDPSRLFDPEKLEHTQRYYELASQLLHTFPFTSPTNKSIWRRHTLGWKDAEIARQMGLSLKVVKKSIAYVASHIVDV